MPQKPEISLALFTDRNGRLRGNPVMFKANDDEKSIKDEPTEMFIEGLFEGYPVIFHHKYIQDPGYKFTKNIGFNYAHSLRHGKDEKAENNKL